MVPTPVSSFRETAMSVRCVYVFAVLLAAADLAGAGPGVQFSSGTPVNPQRRARVPPPQLAALPREMRTVPDYTVRITMHGHPDRLESAARHRLVSRSTDRVHVGETADAEWLFRRNTLDIARASGVLIDHRTKTLVVYGESDLRNLLGINGWAAIVSLGFDHRLLDQAASTGQIKTVDDVPFVLYKSAQASFWWSAEAGLATEFTPQGGTAVELAVVDSATRGVDESLLRDPEVRFPTYRVVDVAEWLENPLAGQHGPVPH